MAATGGEAGVASVIFRHTDPGGESRTLAFHKTPDGTHHDAWRLRLPRVHAPGPEPAGSGVHGIHRPVSESIPPNVRWQLDILVPRMIGEMR